MKESPGSSDGSGVGSIADENQATMPSFSQITHHGAIALAVPEICKALGIAENTYYRWRNQFGGIKADEMKRLKERERENARLKALVADLALDKAILKEAARGNS